MNEIKSGKSGKGGGEAKIKTKRGEAAAEIR